MPPMVTGKADEDGREMPISRDNNIKRYQEKARAVGDKPNRTLTHRVLSIFLQWQYDDMMYMRLK